MSFSIPSPIFPPLLVAAALVSGVASPPAFAQLVEDRPEGIQGVGIDDKRGAEIPLDLKFRDSQGKVIKLAEIFSRGRPVLLSLNYSSCPMLCRVQLDGLCDGLKQMEWTAGDEFEVVSVSIDPNESPAQADLTKKKYVEEYARPGAAGGWHFLTGLEANIRELADTVGFRYKYVEERQEYAHTASVIVCSPDGVVNRYLNGVMFDPQTVRLSLVEASAGKMGGAFDQLLLFCFHYDETSGRYGPMAQRIMAAGGAVTVIVLGLSLLPFWLRKSGGSAAGLVAAESVTAGPVAANAAAGGVAAGEHQGLDNPQIEWQPRRDQP